MVADGPHTWGAGPPPPAISPLIPTITPAGETSGRDDLQAADYCSLQVLVQFKAPELLHFKTEPSIQRHKTAVSVWFSLAKKRGFGTGFDNRNNTVTNYKV